MHDTTVKIILVVTCLTHSV